MLYSYCQHPSPTYTHKFLYEQNSRKQNNYITLLLNRKKEFKMWKELSVMPYAWDPSNCEDEEQISQIKTRLSNTIKHCLKKKSVSKGSQAPVIITKCYV